MLSTYWRHGLVVALALVAGLLTVAARPVPTSRLGVVPSTAALIAGTDWHIVKQDITDLHYARTGMIPYATPTLANKRGIEAQLFLSPANVQKILQWTGELGYEGAGYETTHRPTVSVPLGGGRTAPASLVIEQHLTDRELVMYDTVSADAIVARSAGDLLRAGWDMLRGDDGLYYVVRVSVPSPSPAYDATARAAATDLLGHLVVGLSADVHAASAS